MGRRRHSSIPLAGDTGFTEAELQQLEDFIAEGGSRNLLEALDEKFGFIWEKQRGEGAKYRWQRVVIPDPDVTDETAIPKRYTINGTLDAIVTVNKEDGNVAVQLLDEILDGYALDPTDYLSLEDEAESFWEWPGSLYHATQEDNVEDILADGLLARAETRGLRNRSVGLAVFTTANEETARSGTYGEAVFEIDTKAMKRDRYTPLVSREPDVVEAEQLNALARAFDLEDREFESENDPDTFIIHGNVPAKYLKQIQ